MNRGVITMLKKTITLYSSIIICIILVGCSNSFKDENAKLKSEIFLKESKITELEKYIKELKDKTESLEASLKYVESEKKTLGDKLSKNKKFYGIYIADVFTYDKEIYFFTYIPEEKTIKQKLYILANALSQTVFDNLPIEVVKIEEVDGKRIAVINLMESKENQKISDYSLFKGRSWATGYFQGSAGGRITSTSLIETFLQKQYDGEWIDGVSFLYNGGKEGNWSDHAPQLGEVNYRK